MSHNHCSDFIAFLSGHDHKNCTRQLHKIEHCVIESFERTIKSCGQIQEVLLPAQLIHETENKAIFVNSKRWQRIKFCQKIGESPKVRDVEHTSLISLQEFFVLHSKTYHYVQCLNILCPILLADEIQCNFLRTGKNKQELANKQGNAIIQ